VHGIEDKVYSAVLGVPELHVGQDQARISPPGGQAEHTVHSGDVISIHGQTGEVYIGTRPLLIIDSDGSEIEMVNTRGISFDT
jgi:hypothetical protein